MEWMEQYTYEFDRTRAFATGSPSDWLTSDFSVQLSDGTRIDGMQEAIKALTEKYAPSSGGHKHDPIELFTWEEDDHWCMFGHAKCFIGFDGTDSPKEAKEWQHWQSMGDQMISMVFCVECQSGSKPGLLHLDVCHSESNYAPSSPLREQNGNILSGIRRFPLFFVDIDNLDERDFIASTAEAFAGDGDIAPDEDESDDGGAPEDNEKDGDYEFDSKDDFQYVRSDSPRRQQTQKRSTGRPCGHDLQPMQRTQRAASLEEDDDEEPKPVLVGTRTKNVEQDGDEDVEMRDFSESEEDGDMSEHDECDDVSEASDSASDSDSDSDSDDDMSEGAENGEDPGKDKPYFLVKAWIQTRATADNLDITLYLMKAHYKYSWEQSLSKQNRIGPIRTRNDLNKEDTLSEHTDAVWSKGSSHLVSNTTGASGPRGL